jgi:hypothetical protein
LGLVSGTGIATHIPVWLTDSTQGSSDFIHSSGGAFTNELASNQSADRKYYFPEIGSDVQLVGNFDSPPPDDNNFAMFFASGQGIRKSRFYDNSGVFTGIFNDASGIYLSHLSGTNLRLGADGAYELRITRPNGGSAPATYNALGNGALHEFLQQVRVTLASGSIPHLRLAYNSTNYMTVQVTSAGAITFDAAGASAGFTFADNVTIATSKNIVMGSSSSIVGPAIKLTADSSASVGGATAVFNGGAALGGIDLTSGSGITATTLGGDIRVTSGAGNTTGRGGNITVLCGAGGATGDGGEAILRGGPGGATSGAGGRASVIGGNATGGVSAGGVVRLLPGIGFGGGAAGTVQISDPTTGNLANLLASTLTANRNFTFPDASGTFVLLPVAPPAYTLSGVTTDRAFDANATSLDEIADVLGTLIADLQSIGLVG